MIDPDKVYREYQEAGTNWADKLGAAKLLEHTLKSLKSKLTLEAKHAEGCSISEAVHHAEASDKYMEVVVMSVEATTEANRARVRYDSVQALFEARRSLEASHRAAARSGT